MQGDESILMRRATEAVERLERAQRRYRAVIWGLVLAFILLALGGWYTAQQGHDSCAAGNNYRAGQQLIWDDVLAISIAQNPPKPGSPQAKIDDQFRAYVHHIDAPRACPLSLWP